MKHDSIWVWVVMGGIRLASRLRQVRPKAGAERFGGEKPTGGIYPAATIRRGCARIAAGMRKRGTIHIEQRKNTGWVYPCAAIYEAHGTSKLGLVGRVGVEPTAR